MNDGKDKSGLLACNEDGTFYIPREELMRYRLPTDVAAGVSEAMAGTEVAGFRMPSTPGVKPTLMDTAFSFTGSFSSKQLPCQYSDCPI